jgi:ADP-dependent phosphofructokinase/glucokinase
MATDLEKQFESLQKEETKRAMKEQSQIIEQQKSLISRAAALLRKVNTTRAELYDEREEWFRDARMQKEWVKLP